MRTEDILLFFNRCEVVKVYVNDIIYIESDMRRIHVHTNDYVVSTYVKLDEIAPRLPENFYRCHKGYIINFDKVIRMKSQEITFECGESILICADKFRAAIQSYRGYLIRTGNMPVTKNNLKMR